MFHNQCFAKSLDVSKRAWVRNPPTPPTLKITHQRNLVRFLFCNATRGVNFTVQIGLQLFIISSLKKQNVFNTL